MLKPYIIPAILGAIHIAYILIAFICPKNKKEQSNGKKFSVEHIVCFKNESKFIEKKLINCYSIDYPYIHHTFVNDNSADNTLDLLRKYKKANTKITNNKTNLGKNQSQIKTVRQTNSDILLFTDANVFLEEGSVREIVKDFHRNTAGLCGNVRVTIDMKHQDASGRYWEIEKGIKKFQSLVGSVIGFDGGFYCVKRENYILKRENELSDFETAFLIFEQQRQSKYSEDAHAIELEKRKLKDTFMARIRAANRVFWSFLRIFRYINELNPSVIIHFTLHKLIRYLFMITFVLSLPFIIIDLFTISPFLLLIFLIPQVLRFIMEGIALCIGGVIALSGKEYTTWSHKKA